MFLRAISSLSSAKAMKDNFFEMGKQKQYIFYIFRFFFLWIHTSVSLHAPSGMENSGEKNGISCENCLLQCLMYLFLYPILTALLWYLLLLLDPVPSPGRGRSCETWGLINFVKIYQYVSQLKKKSMKCTCMPSSTQEMEWK